MVKNVRWLYNKLGTVDISATGSDTISGGINAVQNNIDGKANASHTHGVGDLPVSNSSVNSASYVPSSAVVYSLKSTISDLSAEVSNIEDEVLNPNKRYESKSLGTWNSTTVVNEFLSRFNHNNVYKDGDTELAIGNQITINGTIWEIAGFDIEHNQTAADGTVYDNGYGICLIPMRTLGEYTWKDGGGVSGGYKASTMHTVHLTSIASTLNSSPLGSHLINRNVLLSSSVSGSSGSEYSNGYTWTTAKATLLSGYQLTGTAATYSNKYDDGEANYKLPLFDYENYGTKSCWYWLRGIAKSSAYMVNPNSTITETSYSGGGDCEARPMIYIR